MNLDVTPLFEPLQVKGKTLHNRIVMPPMVVVRGITTPEGIEWYRRRACGGVALVIVESTRLYRFGADLTVETLRPLVEAIHAGGALAAIQIFPALTDRTVRPADLAADEIRAITARYRTAAEVCATAGFDGIEPHGAHGYLLNQFFSPTENERVDGWGGSLKNRMRLALEIVEAARPTLDRAGMLLLYRHTPVGPSYGIEESQALARALIAAGVDILDISPASAERPGDRSAPFVGLGAPVIAVNALGQVERALEVLRERRGDLVAVGRGLIADPDWALKVREGRLDEIVECIQCDEGCFGNLHKGVPVECTQWA